MKIKLTLIFFFLYALLGWGIEFIYRSVLMQSLVFPGYLSSIGLLLPLLPIYGFGALILIRATSALKSRPIIMRALIYTLVLTTLELVGGIFSKHILHQTLWDYSTHPFNLAGHISPLQSILLLIGALMFEKFHPWVVDHLKLCYTREI